MNIISFDVIQSAAILLLLVYVIISNKSNRNSIERLEIENMVLRNRIRIQDIYFDLGGGKHE